MQALSLNLFYVGIIKASFQVSDEKGGGLGVRPKTQPCKTMSTVMKPYEPLIERISWQRLKLTKKDNYLSSGTCPGDW